MSSPRGPMFGSDEPVPMMIEAVVRLVLLVMRSVLRLVRFAIRRPRVASVAGSLLVLDRYAGHVAVLALLAALVVGLVVWRVAWPDSYGGRSGHASNGSGCWRRTRASGVGSPPGSGSSSTTTPAANKPWVYGGLGDVRVTPAGIVRLRVAIPTGLTLDDYARKADALGVAFGVREARVSASGPGSVWIELHRTDVLATTIGPLPVGSEPEVNLAGIPVGRHEDGTEWRFSLWQTHVLIAGATGAGKGSILWSLLRGLAPAINAGWVQVWAIDPKGGMELRPGQRLFSRFEDGTPETMCDLLEDLVAVMDQRAKKLANLGIRKHQPTPDSPHLLAVIDELATLTAFAERDVVRRIDKALGLLLTKGRAVGITVLAAVQDPGKDVVGWRDLFPTRVAMRLDNPIQVDMVLGEGARDMGATADHINERTPGVAFVRVEGTRAIRRVRASYLTDDDIAALAGSVTASPALTAPRAPKPVDPLDSWPRPVPPGPTQEPTPGAGAKPRKPRTPRKPRNRDGSQVA